MIREIFFLLSHSSSSYFLTHLLLTFLLAFFLLSRSLWAPTADHIPGWTRVKMRKTRRKTRIKTHRIEMNMLMNHSTSSSREQLQRILNMKITQCVIIWFILRSEARLIIWWMRYCLITWQSISELEHTLRSCLNVLQ